MMDPADIEVPSSEDPLDRQGDETKAEQPMAASASQPASSNQAPAAVARKHEGGAMVAQPNAANVAAHRGTSCTQCQGAQTPGGNQRAAEQLEEHRWSCPFEAEVIKHLSRTQPDVADQFVRVTRAVTRGARSGHSHGRMCHTVPSGTRSEARAHAGSRLQTALSLAFTLSLRPPGSVLSCGLTVSSSGSH